MLSISILSDWQELPARAGWFFLTAALASVLSRRAARFARGVTGFVCKQRDVLSSEGIGVCWFGFYVAGRNSRGLYASTDRGLPSPITRATKGTQIKF